MTPYQAEVFPDGPDEDEVGWKCFRFQLPLQLRPELTEGYVRQNPGERRGMKSWLTIMSTVGIAKSSHF